MLHFLQKIIALIRLIFTTFVVLCFAFMCVAVGFQVLARYVFNFQIGDATEAATFAQIWLALAGCGVAYRAGTIFAIESLPALLPLNLARAVKVLIAIVSVSLLFIMIYGGIKLYEIGKLQTSPTLLIPMDVIYIVLPISMAYFALEVVLDVIEHWDDPFAHAVVDLDHELPGKSP